MIEHLTPKGAQAMADTKAHAAWQKENTVMVSVRLQKSTDSDILEFLDGKSKQAVIKEALREYMKSRPE